MHPKLNFIWSRVFLLTAICLFILSCVHRLVHIDDAYLAEQSYWLARVGKVKSELFRGMMGYEVQNFVYHKLYIWQGALVTKFLGFNVYYLKSIALFYLVGFLTMLAVFAKQQKLNENQTVWILFLALTNPWIFELSFVFRPDIAVTFFGLLSCYFLMKEKLNWPNTIIAAMGAGFASATHLNGLIFISTGGVFLLYKKAWKEFFVYGFIASVFALFYLHDVRSIGDLKTLIFQLTHDPMVVKESYGIWSLPFRVFDEQRRYFHSPPEIAYTLVLLICAGLSWRVLWKEKKDLCVYTMALAFSLAILAHGKTSKYLVYLIPMHLILISWAYVRQPSKGKLASLFAYILVSWWVSSPLILKPDILLKENRKWAQYMQPGSKVLAPLWFIFNNIDGYQIQGTLGYEFAVMAGQAEVTPSLLFGRAAQYDNKYILLNPGYQEYFQVTAEDHPPYKLIRKDKYWLFEKVD